MFKHVLRISFVLLAMLSGRVMASPGAPVVIGLDGAYGLANSTSAQSIEKGVRIAIEEINAAGGVLNGRKLKLVTRDNRSMPARGIQNINAFSTMSDLVAVVSGRFTPVVMGTLESLLRNELINLAAWSAGDPVVHHGHSPNYVFRLLLRDSLAMPKMISFAAGRGARRIGFLLTNTAWGRSNEAAAKRYLKGNQFAAIGWDDMV